MGYEFVNLPPQQLPMSKKTKKWRKKHLDWADSKAFFNYSLVRKSVIHKKINYDLINGKIHMKDLELVLNPENIKAGYIPDRIQHYPIINSKLNVLKGEEIKRLFDWRVVVTNPNAVSDIENKKKAELFQRLQETIEQESQSEEQFNEEIQKLSDYYQYEYQDFREMRANFLLQHYTKEYNMPLIFSEGFMDGMIVGEEIYQCDIVGGEPTIQRLNPLKVRVFKSGYSNKIEDADIIIIEDYWNPGKIIDTYYDVLTSKDREYLENLPDHIGQTATDTMDNVDDRFGFINNNMIGEELSTNGYYFDPANLFSTTPSNTLLPYDIAGNVRVLRMYWKSRRKIKKVKSYNPITGEEEFEFYPESYIIDTDKGEEEEIFYINQAWEGTKIGTEIYVNMRPRVVQYNRLCNPSRCHFGIVGSIYNLNDNKPFSLVDMMKPYSYEYDIIHDRLNKLLANNWGKIIQLDFAKIPKGWDVDKWMYYAKVNNIAVIDSFKEGQSGAATGKIAGALNNNTTGVIDAEVGNIIQQNINLLEFIKMEMSEVCGISKQREGQVSNRETVGGVERATLQSSYITEWLFFVHDDVKRRALDVFIETAKIALKGRKKKFQYILPDNSMKIMEIDGDEFAECDYGLLMDNSNGMQELKQKLETLAQAALQNQSLSFSTIMKLYNSCSLAEKQRIIEKNEREMIQRQEQAQQQQMQMQQEQVQAQLQQKQMELEHADQINIRDNETRILIANIQASNKAESIEPVYSEEAKANLMEKIREFDAKIKLDEKKFELEKHKTSEDIRLREKQINKMNNKPNTK